jgi:hypothetical protein
MVPAGMRDDRLENRGVDGQHGKQITLRPGRI